MSDLLAGRKLGPYELQEMIGQGGMGVVYRARQLSTARDVAIKLVSAAYVRQPDFLRRFEQEAQASARLQHPHILPVHDAGVASGQPYLVTAYLPGGTLAARLSARPAGLPLAEVVRICGQVAAALDYAHSEGVIHCDVKPGNVLLDELGNAYLADFGIARLVESSDIPATALGTVPYVAPEVLAGHDPSPASDIYGLGVLAFEMLTGRLDSEANDHGDTRAVNRLELHQHRPDVPRGVSVVLGQALNGHPGGRPPHARSLARALALASGFPAPEENASPARRAPGPKKTVEPEAARAPSLGAPPPGGIPTPPPELPDPGPPVISRPTRVHQPNAPTDAKPPQRLMCLLWGGLGLSTLLLLVALLVTLGRMLTY